MGEEEGELSPQSRTNYMGKGSWGAKRFSASENLEIGKVDRLRSSIRIVWGKGAISRAVPHVSLGRDTHKFSALDDASSVVASTIPP